jgi:predicted DsbA family dithiol-disulfide isomerase
MDKMLTVQIWSDVICPWCWIAERRLQQALAKFPHRAQVNVVHRAYRIKLHEARRPVEEMLAEKLGSRGDPLQFLSQIEAVAARDGLDYHLAGTCVGDTTDAHRVVKLARKFGVQSSLLEMLYRGYFTQHEDLLDRRTLLRLAQDAGIEGVAVEALFEGDDFLGEVEDDQREALQRGITGVPYFLFGESTFVGGAETETTLASTLALAWGASGVLPKVSTDAPACGADGCTIP